MPSSTTTGRSTLSLEDKRLAAAAILEKERRAKLKHKQRLEDDLAAFFRAAWSVLEPGRRLEDSWHYDLMAEWLWLVREREFKKVYPEMLGIIWNVPPRTAKSTFLTVCFPVWCWLKRPSMRFSCYSYSLDLSTEHSVKRRNLINSEWFQSLWGDRFQMVRDQNQKTHFDNDQTGQMIATSVGGTATGKGGDVLIVDDPLNPEQAASDTERNNANTWIDNTLRSRMNDMSNDVICMVMQRLHELDCTGYLIQQNPDKFIHISIPLEEEGVKTPDGTAGREFTFPLSGRTITRAPGDILMPGKFPPASVEALKVLRLVWAGQMQQRPAPLEGNLIKRSDVQYYGGLDPVTGHPDRALPDRFDLVLVSIDAAFKDEKTSDYVSVMAVGVDGPDRYLLNLVLKHLDAEATKVEAARQRLLYKASVVLIEDKANGSAVIKALKQKLPGIIAVNPEGGKMSRMMAASPSWQSHNWFVDRNAAYTEPFITSCLNFPNAAHDDDVDSMTQAEVWLQTHGCGLFDLWKKQAAAVLKAQGNGAEPKGADSLAAAQKRDFANETSRPTIKGRKAEQPRQDDPCPTCGNQFPQRRREGKNLCSVCSTEWTTPGFMSTITTTTVKSVVGVRA